VLAAATSVTQSTCGQPNGSASVVASGGTPAYTYSWAPNGGSSASATGLLAGTYTVYITDANGCTISATAVVPNAGSPTATISASANVSCFNGNNGSATVTVTGGTGPYTISWTPSGGTATTATGLTAGSYTVTVTDANGCSATANVTITQPALLTAAITNSVNVLCFGGSNGSATVTASGGTAPYTYAWAPSGGTSATATGLTAGNYSVTITDANGCTATANVTITQPTQLTIAVAGFSATCNGSCNGQGVCIPSGGTPGYTFSWAPGGGTNPSANNLCVGVYTVYVTDQNGCTINDTAVVNQPTPLVIATSSTTAHCNQADGSACANASGGTPPYSYAWNPSAQTASCASNIAPGTYTVTITDFNGCTATATVVVPNAAGVVASITGSTMVTCFGNCDGTANAAGNGGNTPYTYAWAPNGGTNANATGLCAGTYTCTITDANGCSDTATVVITQPAALTVATTQVDITCNGACTGTATANPAGGTAPYTYSWSNGQLTPTATGLCAGTYSVTVTDANNCTHQVSVTINQPTPVVAGASASPAVICIGGGSTLTASANGGTPGYTYSWWSPINATGSTATITPATTTTYTVTATDANGCTDTTTVTVTVNPLPVISFTSNPTPATGCAPLCVDFTNTTPNGVSCFWDFQVATSNNCTTTQCYQNAGTYDVTLTVTDINGCVNTLTMPAYVTVYPNPVADFTMSPQPTTILNGTIQFTDLSQGNPTQWAWSFGDVLNSSSTIQNPTFTYTDTGSFQVQLIVTTQYGCSDTAIKTLRIDPDFVLYVPNAFTPNSQGPNDTFYPQGMGVDQDKFKMWIFDRWGNMIWFTETWGRGWDGRANDGNDIAQIDVYVWKIELYDIFGTKHSYVGHVTLLK
jgi:gliding motility-associated-like protein